MQLRKTLRIFDLVFLTLPVKTAPQPTYMNTLILTTVLLLIAHFSSAQKYEYLNITQVKAGIADKARVDFNWPDKPDSAKALSNLKLRDPIEAVQTMESKGFELVSINEYGPGSLVIIVSAYMRRKKR